MMFNRFALTEARERAGIKKLHLARRSGHSAPYITQIESGVRTSPSLEAINAWCEVLGISDPRALYLEPTVDELLRELLASPLLDEAVAAAIVQREAAA